MNFYIMTLFPDMVNAVLCESIIGRAQKNGCMSVKVVNIRDYTLDRHKKVDDYPYGGGAGMVMAPQPIYDCHKAILEEIGGATHKTIYLSPQGRTFIQPMAKEYAKEENLILLCGHYEGVDERVLEAIVDEYVSIGDYVLTGGELGAMVMVDAISRMVPGVLTNDESGSTETFEDDLLEYPQYTRPAEWEGREVPPIILSGDHAKVEAWRYAKRLERTMERRPDLYEKALSNGAKWPKGYKPAD